MGSKIQTGKVYPTRKCIPVITSYPDCSLLALELRCKTFPSISLNKIENPSLRVSTLDITNVVWVCGVADILLPLSSLRWWDWLIVMEKRTPARKKWFFCTDILNLLLISRQNHVEVKACNLSLRVVLFAARDFLQDKWYNGNSKA